MTETIVENVNFDDILEADGKGRMCCKLCKRVLKLTPETRKRQSAAKLKFFRELKEAKQRMDAMEAEVAKEDQLRAEISQPVIPPITQPPMTNHLDRIRTTLRNQSQNGGNDIIFI